MSVTIDDIRAAAALLDGAIVKTPTAHSRVLSALCGCDVMLKFENLQYTASFKDRGALVKLASLSDKERRQRGFDTEINRQTVEDLATVVSVPGATAWRRINAFGPRTGKRRNHLLPTCRPGSRWCR